MAVSAALGAARPSAAPLVLAGLVVVAAWGWRLPVLLSLGVSLLTSGLAARSLAGLDGVEAGPVAASVELVSDPVASFGGVRAEARLGGRRVELRATGTAAAALAPRLAGERLTVRGELEPLAPSSWRAARHLSGRVRADVIDGWSAGSPVARLANGLRRTLLDGAAPLDPAQQALFAGLVIGDDRAQPVELADDFLGAGLTHLLAVSGQNVAFLLALAHPLLRRMGLWPRLAGTLAVVVALGFTTRFEPSVLRAAAMAAVAATAATIGSPARRLRVLALAVTALLVVDPLLVRSVGFQLSVAASLAIVVAAPPIRDVLPVPAWLREPLAVTVAAQLGVAPVLVATFGPVPVASLPANLLGVPAAGPVMVWGLTGGLVAGLAGGWAAELLHLPTQLLLVWLTEVASRAARLPLGQLGPLHLLGLGTGLVVAVWARRRLAGRIERIGLAVAAGAVLAASLAAQAPAPLRSDLLPGVVRWHAGSTDVVVLGGVGGRTQLGATAVLAALREAAVPSIDLLVVADRSVPASVVVAIEHRHPVGSVVVSGQVRGEVDGVRAPVVVPSRPGGQVSVGDLAVRVTVTPERLVVEARPVGAGAGAR